MAAPTLFVAFQGTPQLLLHRGGRKALQVLRLRNMLKAGGWHELQLPPTKKYRGQKPSQGLKRRRLIESFYPAYSRMTKYPGSKHRGNLAMEWERISHKMEGETEGYQVSWSQNASGFRAKNHRIEFRLQQMHIGGRQVPAGPKNPQNVLSQTHSCHCSEDQPHASQVSLSKEFHHAAGFLAYWGRSILSEQ